VGGFAVNRDYTPLLAELRAAYAHHSPKSAALGHTAEKFLVDGGSHAYRLLQPFAPRIASAHGACITDEDGHEILDFWQGHYANVLGHNPEIVTKEMARAFDEGFGLQSGFTDQLQIETAEILCRQTGSERVRFTISGSLATMYAIFLARAFTDRDLVLKVGGGWHGAHPWGLKGVGFHDGFRQVESAGIPKAITDEVLVTGYNDAERLKEDFHRHGDELACFIVEPFLGAAGLMPATREYLQIARQLTHQYGALLIFDEVISGFRFRAGDLGALYDIRPDLATFGKAIGGGMPVAAVTGRADIMSLAGREQGSKVKFSGGTYSAHPASMLAAKTYMQHLIAREAEIYPRLADLGNKVRVAVAEAFAQEGIFARFAGEENDVIPVSSLNMLLFPYEENQPLNTPDQVRDPTLCDVNLSEKVLQLALLLENVFIVHGLGSLTTAHDESHIEFLSEACRRAARRFKRHL
jgi:glutamate-1-semialdehyde 2,1-aminomutase